MLRAMVIVAMMAAAVVSAADDMKTAGHPMDDPLWLAAQSYVNNGGDRRSLITPPAPPSLPPKVTFTALTSSVSGVYTVFDNQPLNYQFALSGENASITNVGDNSTLYYQLEDYTCEPTETSSRSFQISTFQVPPRNGTNSSWPEPAHMCWRAPAGYVIVEGLPVTYKAIIQTFYVGSLNYEWTYAGTANTDIGSAQLWTRSLVSSLFATSVLATRESDGVPVYYQTRINSGTVSGRDGTSAIFKKADAAVTMTFSEYTVYGEDEEVPNAEVPADMMASCEDNVFAPDDTTVAACKNNPQTSNVQAAYEAFQEGASKRATGHVSGLTSEYPSTEMPYDMVGDQDMVMSLPSFVPPMANRSYMPVRNQGGCGSCYSFSTASSISSAYSQANPGTTMVFSNQEIMNCVTLDLEVGQGSGCWGGMQNIAIDWLVATGGEMTSIQDTPYIGFQGTCSSREGKPMYQTNITGWSPLTSVAEIKNSLYYRGDVSITSGVDGWQVPDPSAIIWPDYLGVGLSMPGPTYGHAINIIGWGPCLVHEPFLPTYPCGVPGSDRMVQGECWIVQNSWGINWGFNGYLFINTNPACDYGITNGNHAMAFRMD